MRAALYNIKARRHYIPSDEKALERAVAPKNRKVLCLSLSLLALITKTENYCSTRLALLLNLICSCLFPGNGLKKLQASLSFHSKIIIGNWKEIYSPCLCIFEVPSTTVFGTLTQLALVKVAANSTDAYIHN